ncbi:MAG: heat shock protein HspQ [Nitrospinales bacterium]|jgi:heat shock protein HspQ|nr:heat shock protein HspQ [Nitrospinales bacterium]|tara:strand:- start:17 stop:262 length:246 start_codon:yes stop_codon:yes gene_type:complete
MSESAKAKYCIGQLIQHKLFDYRGIILGVDLEFKSTDEWYEMVAKSRPPKNEPWYHVLVHQKGHQTYVAEQNLQIDPAIQN